MNWKRKMRCKNRLLDWLKENDKYCKKNFLLTKNVKFFIVNGH
jgi:hypothetical protein